MTSIDELLFATEIKGTRIWGGEGMTTHFLKCGDDKYFRAELIIPNALLEEIE
jgi:hypothetical protein